MGTGQMLMVILALSLLAIVSLNLNTLLIGKTSSMLEIEANVNGIALGQSMLDEALSASYDAVTADGTKIYDSTKFTPANSLGPSSAESGNVPLPDSLPLPAPNTMPNVDLVYKSAKYYNDVDDYNGYKRIAFTPTMATFYILDTVVYVTEANPDQVSTHRTFYKKVIVTVRHRNMVPAGKTFNPWSGPYCLQLTDIAVYRRYF